MKGRVIGLDVGDRRIGIALSDPGRLIASPHSVYERVGFAPDVRHIAALCAQLEAALVVAGLPLNMDGSRGFQAEKVLALCQRLQEAGLDVRYQDERLTTVTAEKALIEGGMRREDRRHTVDKVAAAVILQQYLDSLRNQQRRFLCNKSKQEDIPMTDDMINDTPLDEDNIVELTDEDGNVTKFEYITTLPYEDEEYVVLMVLDEDGNEPADDEGEVVILKIEKDENDEDVYVSVDDDDLSQKVFDQFMAMVDEEDEED